MSTTAALVNVLRRMHLDHLVPTVIEHELTATQMRDCMTEKLMVELGIGMGPRLRLLKWQQDVRACERTWAETTAPLGDVVDGDAGDLQPPYIPVVVRPELSLLARNPNAARFVSLMHKFPGATGNRKVVSTMHASKYGVTLRQALGERWQEVLQNTGQVFFVGMQVVCFDKRGHTMEDARKQAKQMLCLQLSRCGIPFDQVAAIYHLAGVCLPCKCDDQCRRWTTGDCSFCHEPQCLAKRAH